MKLLDLPTSSQHNIMIIKPSLKSCVLGLLCGLHMPECAEGSHPHWLKDCSITFIVDLMMVSGSVAT